MTRRQAREHLFNMLFRIEFNKIEELSKQADYYLEALENLTDEELQSLKDDLEAGDNETDSDSKEEEVVVIGSHGSKIDLESLTIEDVEVLKKRFLQIVDKLPEVDKIISKISTGWTINRMGKVDLTTMRIAVYEIKYDEEIPGEVSVNEAVEIAKKYGQESSGSFVNGVLAKLLS